jgi:RNA polymerase sigma-70 factor (ECF subfamily)
MKCDADIANSASVTDQFSQWRAATYQNALIEPSDSDLIVGIAAGDKSAVKVLYARHNVKIYRLALCLVRDEALAEDVTSGTVLEVWHQAGAFEACSQVPTWLLSIAHRKSIAALRRLSSSRDCLTSLVATHREIIDLVYYHQNTIDEIAEIIQRPRDTVVTRMLHARQKLAALLGRPRRAHPCPFY